jgi:hypothetical protein
MYPIAVSGLQAEEAALARLARDFPNVSMRVISAVLTAYRGVTPTLAQAALATHDRIEDARAV